MLKNAYLLATIGADTAENERHFAENLPKIGSYPTGPHDGPGRGEAQHGLVDGVVRLVLRRGPLREHR